MSASNLNAVIAAVQHLITVAKDCEHMTPADFNTMGYLILKCERRLSRDAVKHATKDEKAAVREQARQANAAARARAQALKDLGRAAAPVILSDEELAALAATNEAELDTEEAIALANVELDETDTEADTALASVELEETYTEAEVEALAQADFEAAAEETQPARPTFAIGGVSNDE